MEAFVAERVLHVQNLRGFKCGERVARGADPKVRGGLPQKCGSKISSGNFNSVFKSS